MTHSYQDFQKAKTMLASGLTILEISRITGIPRRTIYDWRDEKRVSLVDGECPRCGIAPLPGDIYCYLLGLYLGDGCITEKAGGVFRFRLFLDLSYPSIIEEARDAIRNVRVSRPIVVGQAPKRGCIEIYGHWKHWPCLFPQHGPGLKHTRRMLLVQWQSNLMKHFPEQLVRGLIHSDGSRFAQTQSGTSTFRYQFTNESEDIRHIFVEACSLCGIKCTGTRGTKRSVSAATDVARMDGIVGPKR